MFGFFFEKFLFIKGVGSKYTLFVFGNFFLQNPFSIKGGGSKDVIFIYMTHHLRLKDTACAFGNFLQNPLLYKL